ncbi:MAG: DUF2914 domain-containing protein [Candidatus Eisenbacteria bacterium]|nr:DUF2914 domain-containing protein [Candidatus Eisenbacteria bacterium]
MRWASLITGLILAAAVAAGAQTDGATPEPPDTAEVGREARADTATVPAPSDSVSADAGEGAEPAPDDAPAGAGLRVLRAYVCKGIEESEPAEAGRSFLSPDDGLLRLCCFSEIAATATDTVLHVWYWGDREMARVPLEVRGPRWRTWSSKRIIEAWRGDWRVDITDRGGDVLERLDFSIE